MNKRQQDLESRLRSYLAAGAQTRPPDDLEQRIRDRVMAPTHSWRFQVAVAAAILLLAVGLGVGLSKARALGRLAGNPTPTASPAVSASATAMPSLSPTPQPTAASYPLLSPSSFKMISASTGWAAGSGTDRILRTSDGGTHWIDVTPSDAPRGTWSTFFLDAQNAWLATSGQPGSPPDTFGSPTNGVTVRIYRTVDGGHSWSEAGTVAAAWGFPASLDFVDVRHGWLLMKQDGTLETPGSDSVAFYGTNDGGTSWEKLSETDTSGVAGHLPLACSKNSPTFLNTSTGWIPGACGAGGGYFLYVSRDGGVNWAAVALRMPDQGTTTCDCAIESLRFSDKQHGVLVLENAYQDARGYPQNFLYTTVDGGRSWQLGPRLPTNAYSVFFLDGQHGWTLDLKRNILLFTSDSGMHWATVGTIPSNSNSVIRDFQFVTVQIGWSLGADSGGLPILKTADGGQTWTTQLAP